MTKNSSQQKKTAGKSGKFKLDFARGLISRRDFMYLLVKFSLPVMMSSVLLCTFLGQNESTRKAENMFRIEFHNEEYCFVD